MCGRAKPLVEPSTPPKGDFRGLFSCENPEKKGKVENFSQKVHFFLKKVLRNTKLFVSLHRNQLEQTSRLDKTGDKTND